MAERRPQTHASGIFLCRQPKGNVSCAIKESGESGLALLPTLLLIVVMAIFLALFLAQQQEGTGIVGTDLMHQEEILALDQGAQEAASTLNGYTDWPEILTASNAQALAPAYDPLPTNQQPTTPTNHFWAHCAQQNTCATFTATENGVDYAGEYVLYPSNGITEKISGYEDQQDELGPTSRQYITYVHVTNSENSAVVVKEFVLRKILL